MHASPSAMGEVEGDAAQDGGRTAEQPGMGRRCGTAAGEDRDGRVRCLR
jgi:hypothetical protein